MIGLLACILAIGCNSEQAGSAELVDKRASLLTQQMEESEVLIFASDAWGGEENQTELVGLGDEAFETAMLNCTWFGVWLPSSHSTHFAVPSENSAAWADEEPSSIIPNRQIVDCIKKNSNSNFNVWVANNLNGSWELRNTDFAESQE